MHDMEIARYKGLVSAVIIQALEDYQHGLEGRRHREEHKNQEMHRAYGDAKFWLTSGDTYPYSFLWCCDMLNVSPDGILSRLNTRGLLADMRKRRAAQQAYSERMALDAREPVPAAKRGKRRCA